MNWELFVLIFYFAAMLGIGIFFFIRSNATTDKDYFLGGRAMGPWVTAMSAQASDMSAWLLMGLPGSILAFGLGQAWIGIGLALGTAANWILIARRLRRFSQAANDSITLPQYLSNRFATKSKTLQVACAIVFFVCFTVYVASAFVAGTNVFTSLFPNIDKSIAMLIFAAILIVSRRLYITVPSLSLFASSFARTQGVVSSIYLFARLNKLNTQSDASAI